MNLMTRDHERILAIQQQQNSFLNGDNQMAEEKKKWIPKDLKKGSFTKFAKSKGESVSEAIHDKNLSPLRKHQAIFAENMRAIARKHKHGYS